MAMSQRRAACACSIAVIVMTGVSRLGASTRPPEHQELRAAALDDLLGRDDVAATAELRRRFSESADKIDRQRIACVLVRRVEDDRVFWDFLSGHARRAVESDMPFPYAFDVEGKALPRQYAPGFLRWANRARTPPEQAAGYAVNVAPLDVFVLALTDDARGRDLLRTGLASPNFMVVYRAAWGLARLRDKSAVPLIISAADAVPAQAGEMVARALLLFVDSPDAQAAADRLITDGTAREALRARARQELQMNIGESLGFQNR
jgi:hypothetical protein